MEKVLISSCLLGIPVRYNGRDARVDHEIIRRWLAESRVIAACPEVSAGRGVPRLRAEIIGSNGFSVIDGFAVVLDEAGDDISHKLMKGAQDVLQLAQEHRIRVAVLKDGSASCGRSYIHNGQFRGIRKRGEVGVTTALLQRHGIFVYNEHQLESADKKLRTLEQVPRGASAG